MPAGFRFQVLFHRRKSFSNSPRRFSLVDYVGVESWLIFDILEHTERHVKWLFFPSCKWKIDPDYIAFQAFVKSLAVVNDAAERAVKAVQEVVLQLYDEKKLQKILMVKSKIDKLLSRTKAAYKEAVEQLTPAEKLTLAHKCGRFKETEDKLSLSSTSDFDSSLDIVDEGDGGCGYRG